MSKKMAANSDTPKTVSCQTSCHAPAKKKKNERSIIQMAIIRRINIDIVIYLKNTDWMFASV